MLSIDLGSARAGHYGIETVQDAHSSGRAFLLCTVCMACGGEPYLEILELRFVSLLLFGFLGLM